MEEEIWCCDLHLLYKLTTMELSSIEKFVQLNY